MEATTVCERLTPDRSDLPSAVSICLFGQRYWVGKLANSLNSLGQSRLRVVAPTLNPLSFRGLRNVAAADVIVRLGFRPGARTLRGYVFDALWSAMRVLNPGAVRVFYWLGTDVVNTTEDLRAGKLRQRCFQMARKDYHLADAPWLAQELEQMKIEALPKTLTVPQIVTSGIPELPAAFKVLTYIPDDRYRFYGGDHIYEAARNLPNVRFEVVGGLGAWVSRPLENLSFRGWQNDMRKFYRDATVVVRLVQHDGTGLTALEGLNLGRHVIYSHPLPHTLRVEWGDSVGLIQKLSELLDLHTRGLLRPNAAGRAYVEENFDHHHCMEDLISYFLRIGSKQRKRRSAVNGH